MLDRIYAANTAICVKQSLRWLAHAGWTWLKLPHDGQVREFKFFNQARAGIAAIGVQRVNDL
jgi:hypothetical protein